MSKNLECGSRGRPSSKTTGQDGIPVEEEGGGIQRAFPLLSDQQSGNLQEQQDSVSMTKFEAEHNAFKPTRYEGMQAEEEEKDEETAPEREEATGMTNKNPRLQSGMEPSVVDKEAVHERSRWNCRYVFGSLVALVLVGVAVVLAVVLPTRDSDNASTPTVSVVPINETFGGKSYSDWSIEWWKWYFVIPRSVHPTFSSTGEDCGLAQSGDVWFLATSSTNEVPLEEFVTVIRESCKIPAGKAIFFPVLSSGCSTVEDAPFSLAPGPGSNADTCAGKFIDGRFSIAGDLSVMINGNPVENVELYRAQSGEFSFEFGDQDDNILEINCGIKDCDNMLASTDGYWILLHQLPKGKHALNFLGTFREPPTTDLFFGINVTYDPLMVV